MTEINEEGLKAARRLAGWEIGDGSWAYKIIRAYLNPEEVNSELDEDDVPMITWVYR